MQQSEYEVRPRCGDGGDAEGGAGGINGYPDYKDSGIEWVGDIPAHWSLTRLKAHTDLLNGFPFKSDFFNDAEGTPLIRIRDITSGTTETRFKGEYDDAYLVHDSDVLIGMDGDFLVRWWEGGTALLNQRCCCLRPQDTLDRRYLYYLLRFPLKIINDLTYYTTVKHLSSGDVLNITMPLPPLDEQRQLVAYLDRKTGEIDALIRKKQALIALLRERRTSVINRAVTKGLDPDVRMKDSGVAWLGEVPEHWGTTRLKFVTSFITSGSRGWAQHYSDEGPAFVRIGNLTRGSIDLDLSDVQPVSPPTGAEGERTRLQAGDLLVSITAHIGSVAVVPFDLGEAYVSQHIALCRPITERVSPAWAGYVLLSEVGKRQFGAALYGGTKDGLGLADVGGLLLPLPPPSDQTSILADLERLTSQIDTLIQKEWDLIVKLQELRTSLISEVVTGKIDVRGAVPVAGEAATADVAA